LEDEWRLPQRRFHACQLDFINHRFTRWPSVTPFHRPQRIGSVGRGNSAAEGSRCREGEWPSAGRLAAAFSCSNGGQCRGHKCPSFGSRSCLVLPCGVSWQRVGLTGPSIQRLHGAVFVYTALSLIAISYNRPAIPEE
jgi:hypothetical protein